MRTYINETLEARALYKEGGGAYVDPDALVVTVVAPDSASTDYIYLIDSEVVKLTTGIYLCRVTATLAGKYKFLFRFTKGGIVDIEAIEFNVLAA